MEIISANLAPASCVGRGFFVLFLERNLKISCNWSKSPIWPLGVESQRDGTQARQSVYASAIGMIIRDSE
jgi:hypothetical protein